jgi:Flp pilus assembly protein TadG
VSDFLTLLSIGSFWYSCVDLRAFASDDVVAFCLLHRVVSKRLSLDIGVNMLKAESTLDTLVVNKMEKYVMKAAKQSFPGAKFQPISSTGFTHSSGQALVEFTLVFLLFLVIAWIPADFGLAFYTGQLAQHASREAARIAAADPNLATATGSCNMPCSSAAGGTALKAAADRMSRVLMPGASISVTLEPANGTNCNRLVEVSVSGEYQYFFYQLLGTMGHTIPDSLNIVRSTSMRWEHQSGCQT